MKAVKNIKITYIKETERAVAAELSILKCYTSIQTNYSHSDPILKILNGEKMKKIINNTPKNTLEGMDCILAAEMLVMKCKKIEEQVKDPEGPYYCIKN